MMATRSLVTVRRGYPRPAAALLAAFLVAGVVWEARGDEANMRCGGAKIGALAGIVPRVTMCRLRDFSGSSSYFTCLVPLRAMVEDAFARADAAGGCLPGSGALPMFAQVDFFVRTTAIGLAPDGSDAARRCANRKLRAAGQKLRRKLACHASALRGGRAPSPTCLTRAETRFAASFAKAEARGGCVTTGDAGDIEADVDTNVDYLLHYVAVRACEDPGGAPVCGGPCTGTDVCIPTGGGTACMCAGATCLAGPAPECGGTCPGGGVCTPDIANFGNSCRCVLPTDPCGTTYPVCGGTCPASYVCGPTSGGLGGTCGCVPEGTTPCADAAAPVCGAGCPPDGSICGSVDSQVGAFFTYVGCACGPSTPCASGGIACPPGQTCIIRVVPSIDIRYCASPSGAFLDD